MTNLDQLLLKPSQPEDDSGVFLSKGSINNFPKDVSKTLFFTAPGPKDLKYNHQNIYFGWVFVDLLTADQRQELPVVPHKAVAEVSKIGNL